MPWPVRRGRRDCKALLVRKAYREHQDRKEQPDRRDRPDQREPQVSRVSRGTLARLERRAFLGPAGASGTIVASTVVSGTTALSAVDPPVGTTVAATASCPSGVISLGGGAQVTATGFGSKNVTLRSSFPAGSNGWRVVASVIGPLGTGEQLAVHPYVLCGKTSEGKAIRCSRRRHKALSQLVRARLPQCAIDGGPCTPGWGAHPARGGVSEACAQGKSSDRRSSEAGERGARGATHEPKVAKDLG